MAMDLMQPDEGRFIVIDAGDGAGKSTAIKAMVDLLASRGRKIFDLVAYTKEHHRLPEIDEPELAEADTLISAEPTYCWVGSAIREEIIKAHADRMHDGNTAALAFSLDRQMLFGRVILPFLRAKPGRIVLQDRGVITSLAYQPLQDPALTLDWLASLDGNRLELSRVPDLFLYLNVDAEVAMQRLAGRGEKTDQQIYENLEFQRKLAARYRDPEVLKPYADGGSRIVEIDASQPIGVVAQDVRSQLASL